CPEMKASLYAWLSYSYISPLLEQAVRAPLEAGDIWDLNPVDEAKNIEAEFAKIRSTGKNLKSSLVTYLYPIFLIQLGFALVGLPAQFLAPYMLNLLVGYVKDTSSATMVGAFGYVLIMLVASVVNTICLNTAFFYSRRTSVRASVSLISEIYRHSLQRVFGKKKIGEDGKVEKDAGLGKIVTLMSSDAQQISDASSFLFIFITTPIEIIVSVSLLVHFLGWSAFGGVIVMALTIPISAAFAKWYRNIFQSNMQATDKRIAVVNEMLQSIRIIKFFAWSPQFIKRIREARAVELATLVKVFIAGAIFAILSNCPPLLISLVTFAAYTSVFGYTLDAQTAFTSLALFNMLAQPMLIFPDYRTFTLRNLDIEFPVGKLSAVCGSTGSGKSSLIQALLGEMNQSEGKAYLPDSRRAVVDPATGLSLSTAYVAQTAWIMNATVRDNILFGSRYDPERYSRVIEACALTRDLETLQGGDLTEIGEKGINLSGGQKQRISLARAAYSTASIVILDDPLSAVDAPTARHLFDECICGFMAGRTRILVTHATGLALPRTDFLVVLKSGSAIAQGSVASVMANPEVEDIISKESLAAGEERAAADAKAKSDAPAVAAPTVVKDHSKKATKLIKKEKKAVGSVKLSVYLGYFAAAGGLWPIWLVVICERLLKIFSDLWIKEWSTAGSEQANATFVATALSSPQAPLFSAAVLFNIDFPATLLNSLGESTAPDAWHYIRVYALISFGFVVMNVLRSAVRGMAAYRAARVLHERLVENVLRAPTSYFDSTPVGRILNVFSSDVKALDLQTMGSITFSMITFVSGVSVIIVCAGVTPFFFLGLIPLGLVYRQIAVMYTIPSRDLKRLNSTTRSPIYAQFTETLK
ncbi:hypothetical protein BDK51DRAFT_18442, partial [Blyttiomyces helicus]